MDLNGSLWFRHPCVRLRTQSLPVKMFNCAKRDSTGARRFVFLAFYSDVCGPFVCPGQRRRQVLWLACPAAALFFLSAQFPLSRGIPAAQVRWTVDDNSSVDRSPRRAGLLSYHAQPVLLPRDFCPDVVIQSSLTRGIPRLRSSTGRNGRRGDNSAFARCRGRRPLALSNSGATRHPASTRC